MLFTEEAITTPGLINLTTNGLGWICWCYPTGYEKMWNSGRNESSKADDVAFVGDIIDELKEYKNLDFGRICNWNF